MAWRKPTEDDLIATLSQNEVDAFRKSAAFEADPVEALLRRTTALVRGYIRSNGNVRVSPNDDTIPESCISPAMDYAAYDILKRMNVVVNESRQKARDDALAFFRDIVSGKFNPESYGTDETEATGGACAVVLANARERVTAHKLEGL